MTRDLPTESLERTRLDRVRGQRRRAVITFLVLSAGMGGGLSWTISQPDRHPFIFAIGLSWLIMTCVGATTSQILLRLDPKRFGFARWERNGRVYEWVGVGVFRWVLRHTPLHWLGSEGDLRSGRSDLDRVLRHRNSAEGAHAIAAGATLAFAAVYARIGHSAIATWLALITIPFHLYPVMLQRWIRGRILRLQRRWEDPGRSIGKPCRPANGDRFSEGANPICVTAEQVDATNGSQPIRSETNEA